MSDVTTTPPPHDVTPVTIEDEMKRSYLDYAMSVIVSRALPDVRDGLKPVHRRILFSMKESGYDSTKPYRKSARIVGDVMGKYHPHGDQAIYDAMVRMAQDFSMRLPLIDGQGNFGSMDGDPPAAMRYTEARLAKAAEILLDDIDKETVEFQANYDESAHEPTVLPARFPNILVNGAGGIAVGMATNIPPHNLGEVIDATVACIDNPDVGIDQLMEIVPGPDFPTGGLILGKAGIHAAQMTGRGSVVMRARTHIEKGSGDRDVIIVTEIPYQVNKARMLERIAEVVREKTVEGVSDLRDESDRHGVRVVIELKRDAMTDVVLNQLFRHTPMQTSFGVNVLALDGGRPRMMPLKEILLAFIDFREEVITRRTAFLLGKARERAHILAGLLVAITNLDPVIELIRRAPDPATAREQLMARDWPAADVEPFIKLIDDPGQGVVDGNYRLSEAQARAILELRLQRLTGMEREKLTAETEEIASKIKDYLEILQSRDRRMQVMREELTEIREAFANERRTEIVEQEFEQDIEDLIQREDMVVTATHGGYVKRVPLSSYRAQNRGGKGRSGMSTREADFLVQIFIASTHTPILFFTSRGMVYMLKVYKLPVGGPTARGKPLVNLLPLSEGETVTTILPLPEDAESWQELFVMFATASGSVRRNRLSDFTNVKANGKIAMKLAEGDRLVSVLTCAADQDVLLATQKSMCIRFPVSRIDEKGNELGVRVFAGRNSTGVRGIKLSAGDAVISMALVKHSDASSDDRSDYLLAANAKRRLQATDAEMKSDDRARDEQRVAMLEQPKFAEMADREEFILTVSDSGLGQLSSAFDYRVTGRGGKGIGNMELRRADDRVVASFLIKPETDEIMMVADGGQIIRMAVKTVRVVGRKSKGVKLFELDNDQRVVSVARLSLDATEDTSALAPEPATEGGEAAS